ncbi:MAG: zf-HC2 domain-containing protein, partial [Myxococcota bacterium]
MSPTDHRRHWAREQLHAYERGEVDPARKAAIESHLADCDECRAGLRQVQGLTSLLNGMGQADLDDLRWRRIREAVRHQLEQEAQRSVTADIMSGRRWVLPAIPAAAAVAFFVWATVSPRIMPPQSSPAPGKIPVHASVGDAVATPEAQQLASGAAPLMVTLASGARLELEPLTELQAIDPLSPQLELRLSVGAVRVRTPTLPSTANAPILRTPAFELTAQSNDFLAGYWANKYFIDVRSGSVRVTGENFESGTIISAGERREVRAQPAIEPSALALSSTRSPSAAAPTRSESTKRKTVRNSRAADDGKVVSRSESGAVTVDVERPEDPEVALWHDAADAYYRKRNLSEAIQLAERLSALQGPYAGRARQLICDAQIALGQGTQALDACRQMLADAATDEERRNIHYTIGTIYRGLIGDCTNAIAHYNRALVF